MINSITTLQSEQPVRRETESLLPPPGFPYHTIAGVHGPQDRRCRSARERADSRAPRRTSWSTPGTGFMSSRRRVAEILRILRER